MSCQDSGYDNEIPQVIAGRYEVKVEKQIADTNAGGVFSAIDTNTGQEVAIKIEHRRAHRRELEGEYLIYRRVSLNVPNEHTIPSIRWYGKEGNYRALVMDMLGPTLQDLFKSHGGPFSLKTVLMIADQLISRVEYLHSQLYIHRGIKPDNFCVGLQDQRKIYMIDLAFGKRYMDPKLKWHIHYMENRWGFANSNWCSLNVSEGIRATRRDDLESLGYMFVFFLKGSLPWHDESDPLEKSSIKRKPLEDLCQGLPKQFLMYLHYCRALHFDDDPDYENIRQLFRRLFLEKGYEYDWEFDWCKKSNKESVAQENGSKVAEDNKEPLEAHGKKNGSNAEKRDGISKEIDEESNNISKADTDRSEISPIDNTGLKQVNEAKKISRSSNRNESTQSECQFR
ncbi:uncharacterized protein IAS62_006396 [Cryptococcus decagattii]|uniref:Protein kinase domain-containing protein n=1 Tax=Cryptococcus decagattii TaxID=1859122 RepID=A0ABZ2B2H7_9TREE